MDTPDSKTPSSTTTNKNNIDNNSRSKLINPSSSDSPAFQDSPIYSYISNLSPILPVKAAPVAQGFPGLASPPLTFTSPRVNLRTSFLNRQLYSSTSSSEFFDDNDKSQKNSGNADNLAKVNNFLKISSISDDKKNCNEENSVQVPQHNASGLPGEFIANPMECTDFFRKRLSVDFPQSVGDGCLVQKNNVTADDKVLDGSALPKVAENAQAKSRAIIKLVKLEPKRKISASSGCSSTLIKLSSGYTSEASHLEFGSLRRCLFDENQRKYSSDGSGSGNPNDDLKSIQEVANTSPSGTIGGRQMISLSKSVNGAGISPTARNYPVAISGIGLHLNSVLNPLSIDNATVDQQLSEKKVVRVIGKTSVFVASNQSDGIANAGSIPTNLSGKVSPCSGETHQNEVSLDATLGSPLASDAETHSKDLILVKADEPSANVHDKRKFDLESAETNMKVNLGSPTKKRKKSLSMPDGDTSKRCNCKRSKCVKLYCDCFAAGLFCGESCACQGCFNRGEFEGTVLETRQQIESRNPLAFVPKVVQPVIDSPASAKEVGNLSTPTSARHKRGCNCKKSMCLKKYCECYQSNVGCSDGCRCEGCKNVYGRREDDSFAKELMINKIADETPGDVLDEKQQGLTGSSDNMKSRLHNLPHVTPLTPALQCSDQKKIGLKSRLSFQRFLQSSTSDHHETLPSKDLPACPGSSLSDGMVLEENSMKPTDFENVAEPKTSIRSGLPPPSSHLCWRSSPMTPITESARSEYLQDFNYSGSKHCEMLEDDTPEILRDSATPSKSVKVRSPSKKRVSPPHNHKPSPESIKICHKFVLRSVPSFPPLTPYSKNRGNNNTRESLD